MQKQNLVVAEAPKFELAVLDGANQENLEELIRENFGDVEITSIFDRVKFPTGGALNFELPVEDPENPVLMPEIVGVIVDHHRVNAYWPGEFTGEGNPPQCYAHDGVHGEGNPGGLCAVCPLNRPGSKGEKRKACKNMWRLFILTSGEAFPMMLTLPPTSVGAFYKFLKAFTFKNRLKLNQAVIKVGLRRVKNANNVPYAEATFSVVEKLPDETYARIKAYVEAMKPILRRPPAVRAGEMAGTVDIPAEEVAQGDQAFEELPF
ncbi:hypothetical protein GFC01_05820 [Desulfofundulus thermobenzoicus]|uniref:Uncharacterized protein n=1 Tax=Desulfofundulus thermobenzoicus TaxID=29376 RepID=A0A6N7IQF4_9FIRM|nr:hypothetical protein [Desulfofundulus thermobenzoicus]MQL51787.1 hypothetical protein [Desulfofundulus thermobenzoicus]